MSDFFAIFHMASITVSHAATHRQKKNLERKQPGGIGDIDKTGGLDTCKSELEIVIVRFISLRLEKSRRRLSGRFSDSFSASCVAASGETHSSESLRNQEKHTPVVE